MKKLENYRQNKTWSGKENNIDITQKEKVRPGPTEGLAYHAIPVVMRTEMQDRHYNKKYSVHGQSTITAHITNNQTRNHVND